MIEVPNLKNENDLFIFLLHTIHSTFLDHAILKGGMLLRLLGSTRKTLDLDYTFVPYTSKKEVLKDIENLFKSIEGLDFEITTNSKAIRIDVNVRNLRAQVEINVATKIKSDVISTANLKGKDNTISPRIIKIMSLDVALAHKIAAWNERRLYRDLFDIYYFVNVQNILPDPETLFERLKTIESRIPKFKKITSLSINDLKKELKETSDQITQKDLEKELKYLIDEIELAGLVYKIKHAINQLILKI